MQYWYTNATPRIETVATMNPAHLFTMWYPEVSRICFPHIEQIPFLNAHPTYNQHISKQWIQQGGRETYHGSILLGSALRIVCSPYIYLHRAVFFVQNA